MLLKEHALIFQSGIIYNKPIDTIIQANEKKLERNIWKSEAQQKISITIFSHKYSKCSHQTKSWRFKTNVAKPLWNFVLYANACIKMCCVLKVEFLHRNS